MSDVNNVSERHFHVAVFYSRQLYGNEDFNQKIVIAKPKIEVLLKTLFRRLVRNLHVKSGAFFSFDPMKQDFIVRDAFRQALAESIKVVDIATNTKKVVSVSENDDDQALKEKDEETFSTHSTLSKREKRDNEEREREREQREEKEREREQREEKEEKSKQEMKLEEEKLEKEQEQKQEQERIKKELKQEEDEDEEEQQKQKEKEKDHIQEQEQEQEQIQKQEIAFDVKKVDEDYNVGDSISVFLDHEQGQNNQNQKEESRRSVLKIPTLVRTVFLS
jgi:hypothetical protein